MSLNVGSQYISKAIVNETKSMENAIICLNKTGTNILEGEKVYIASSNNYSLINYNAFSSIGYTGIAAENINANSSGNVLTIINAPTNTLEIWERVDNKATVVGFFVDGTGTKYAICVLDAQYRAGNLRWGPAYAENILPKYNSNEAALNAKDSATWNMDQIINNYILSNYPSFQYCHQQTLVYNNITYYGLLPNFYELSLIYNNKAKLDNIDITISEYSSKSLSNWNLGGSTTPSTIWSSTAYSNEIWTINKNGGDFTLNTANSTGVVPIFEIPVINK